jgi:hypothetical protein
MAAIENQPWYPYFISFPRTLSPGKFASMTPQSEQQAPQAIAS